jgi:hypothetical protein
MRRGLDIAARTRKLDVDNRLPVKLYYRTADNLLKQANIYREEGNIIDLYILLLRFSSLVSETIPEHRDYRLYGGEKAKYRKVGLQSGSIPMIQLFVPEESRVFLINYCLDLLTSGGTSESSFFPECN